MMQTRGVSAFSLEANVLNENLVDGISVYVATQRPSKEREKDVYQKSINNRYIIWRIHDLQNGRRRFSFCYLIIRYISLLSCLF